MSDLTIRSAFAADIPAIAAIHVAGWQATYRGILPDALLDSLSVEQRIALWTDWIAGDRVHTLVASTDSGVIGFTRLCPAQPLASPPPNSAEVSHLYIHPSSQKIGAGSALFAQALELARSEGYGVLLLWVLEVNERARRFYERFGLQPDGARRTDPGFLGNDAVEVRYQCALDTE
jgi:GNAT superfamily N-acetyltransferase